MGPISEPGIYEVSEDDYHNDPCVTPSLSSSGARDILKTCPAKFWWNSPMNPKREPQERPALNFGRAAHQWLLMGGDGFLDRYFVTDPDLHPNSKVAKQQKADAIERGMTIISTDDLATIRAMKEAIEAHEFAWAAFSNGKPEQTLVWKDKETGVMLRCRPDFLPAALAHIPDYKTAISARLADFERAVWNYGYYQQAAWYLDGIEAVTGHKPQSFFFVVQEKEAPYLINPIRAGQLSIEWGRLQNRRAIRLFAECLDSGVWPGYSADVETAELPTFALRELDAMHQAGVFTKEQAA